MSNANSRATATDFAEDSIGSKLADDLKQIERLAKGDLDPKKAAKWLRTLARYSVYSSQHGESIATGVLRIVRGAGPQLCTETGVTPAECGALTFVLTRIMPQATNDEIGTLATFVLGGLLDGNSEPENKWALRLAVRYLDVALFRFERERGRLWTNEDASYLAMSRICHSRAGSMGVLGIDCITRLLAVSPVRADSLGRYVWMLIELWATCSYAAAGLLPLMVFLSGLDVASFMRSMETLPLDLKTTLFRESQRRAQANDWPSVKDLPDRLLADLAKNEEIMHGRSSSLRKLRADILQRNHYAYLDWNLGHSG